MNIKLIKLNEITVEFIDDETSIIMWYPLTGLADKVKLVGRHSARLLLI